MWQFHRNHAGFKSGLVIDRQLVIFDLKNEPYGIDVARVGGIIKMQEITSMPEAPSIVEGVTNLRGAVLPVVDLRKRFDLSIFIIGIAKVDGRLAILLDLKKVLSMEEKASLQAMPGSV